MNICLIGFAGISILITALFIFTIFGLAFIEDMFKVNMYSWSNWKILLVCVPTGLALIAVVIGTVHIVNLLVAKILGA